jgi:hypothetical protein
MTRQQVPGDRTPLAKLKHDVQQWRFACAMLPPALRTPSLVRELLDAVRPRRALRKVKRVASRRDAQAELFDTKF